MTGQYDVAIVGGGFSGLTAGHVLSRAGLRVKVLECDKTVGGLAGTFEFADGVHLEKFYHHWFNNDLYVPELVKDLGMSGDIMTFPSRTGMYFNSRIWSLSTPLDLLRFGALPFLDRIRLGLLVLQARRVRDWRKIEHLNVREWLEPLCGRNVYRVVWEPLIRSKFSIYAEDVSAVWMWKKLVLRGGTRNQKGAEELAYFRGGFGRLAEALADDIRRHGGEVDLGVAARSVSVDAGRIQSVQTDRGPVVAREYLFTPALPVIARLFDGSGAEAWLAQLRRVRYLGNLCLVLRLKHSLSSTYWLNVNDPGFPFVGVIEHTNFDPPEHYRGTHIAYLSRYLAVSDPLWGYTDEQYFEFAMQHLRRMFPKLDASWVLEHRVWRAEYAQPVTERGYSSFVPGRVTPFANASIATMAQVYPEDRGTNYAIRDGRAVAHEIQQRLAAK